MLGTAGTQLCPAAGKLENGPPQVSDSVGLEGLACKKTYSRVGVLLLVRGPMLRSIALDNKCEILLEAFDYTPIYKYAVTPFLHLPHLTVSRSLPSGLSTLGHDSICHAAVA